MCRVPFTGKAVVRRGTIGRTEEFWHRNVVFAKKNAIFKSSFEKLQKAIGANGKFTVQLRGTTALEVPLAGCGSLMVTETYLDWLITLTNEKFDQNQKMIDKLFAEHSKLLAV